MTEYIGLLLTPNDADVLAVNAELAKGDEGVDLGLFYNQKPVPIRNPGDQVVCWHVLVTREQYDARKAANKPVTSFLHAPANWKNNGIPFHVFGPNGIPRLPSEEIEPEEIDEPIE